MNICPCCSEVLLRHARQAGVYWFCPHCWQEMPELSLDRKNTQISKTQELDSRKILVLR